LIIVLEGINAVGKTTLARTLAARSGACILRPFRPDEEFHFTGHTDVERELGGYGVPVNTHVDDLYVADILSKLWPVTKGHVILDRSMPSALAYGDVASNQNLRLIGDAVGLMDLWHRTLSKAGAVRYVWLRSSYAAVCQRLASRGSFQLEATTYSKLEALYERLWEMVKFDKIQLDTSESDVEENMARVLCLPLKS
jgi:thymidylate kinase